MKEPKGQHSPNGNGLVFTCNIRVKQVWPLLFMTPAVFQDTVAPHQVLVVFCVLQITLSPDYYRTRGGGFFFSFSPYKLVDK